MSDSISTSSFKSSITSKVSNSIDTNSWANEGIKKSDEETIAKAVEKELGIDESSAKQLINLAIAKTGKTNPSLTDILDNLSELIDDADGSDDNKITPDNLKNISFVSLTENVLTELKGSKPLSEHVQGDIDTIKEIFDCTREDAKEIIKSSQGDPEKIAKRITPSPAITLEGILETNQSDFKEIGITKKSELVTFMGTVSVFNAPPTPADITFLGGLLDNFNGSTQEAFKTHIDTYFQKEENKKLLGGNGKINPNLVDANGNVDQSKTNDAQDEMLKSYVKSLEQQQQTFSTMTDAAKNYAKTMMDMVKEMRPKMKAHESK